MYIMHSNIQIFFLSNYRCVNDNRNLLGVVVLFVVGDFKYKRSVTMGYLSICSPLLFFVSFFLFTRGNGEDGGVMNSSMVMRMYRSK